MSGEHQHQHQPGDGSDGGQGPSLYPIGRALRATFDADNHDTLGDDLTALMLKLARVEPTGGPPPAEPVAPPVEHPVEAPPSWSSRLAAWLRRCAGLPGPDARA